MTPLTPGQASAPSPRIGDAERDQAVTLLQEHMAAGRLDQGEFDDRMTAALTARTQTDLDALFVDLPGQHPGQQVTPTPAAPSAATRPVGAAPARRCASSTNRTLVLAVLGLMGLGLIISSSFAGSHHWWIFMIPVLIAIGAGRRQRCGRR